MTEEDKELLLKDLCGRLPYKVMGHATWTYQEPNGEIKYTEKDRPIEIKDLYDIWNFKPYLRPMSSMTGEELNKLRNCTGLLYDNLDLTSFQNGAYKCLDFYLSEVPADIVIKVFDWLNSHHFDYRGLIEMGLALEALKGMYNKTKQSL